MATYTDNYQLTKPTYAEQADIGVINSNMNKIDDIMHSSQISLAPAYDSTQTYAEGDVVMYELLMYKCISPTTGVWDGSKWERTTASESGGGGSAELDILGEASGAVASFADGASAGLAKCIAEIVPKQDLHGYSKPWAGGAGKNKLAMSVSGIKEANEGAGTWTGNKKTINGVEFTILEDSDGNCIGVNANGTASADATLVIAGSSTPTVIATYTSDIIADSSIPETIDDTIFANVIWGDERNYVFKRNQSIVATYNMRGYGIRILSGKQATNLVFYPMIRLSGESSDFEPYSNICPISGSTSVTVTISDGETSTTKTTSLGQTVYGGQLNVLTGELTIDRGFITLDGSENWQENTGQNGYTLYNILPTAVTRSDGISNEFYVQTSYYTNMSLILGQNNRHVYAVQINNNISGVTDLTSWKSWLSNNNCQICFEVTPQTVQLTPAEVNSLLGQNNISADTGDIDIVYVKASAPIQPNPTGEPTATLSKLGIEGTVFEIPSGGGGSSEEAYDNTERTSGTYFNKSRYRMSFTVNAPSGAGSHTIATLSNYASIDKIIKIEGCLNGSSASYVIPYADGNIDAYLSYDKTTGDIKFIVKNDNWSGYVIDFTVYYTKITD